MGTYDDELVTVRKPPIRTETDASGPSPAGAPTERRILQLQREAGNGRVAQLLQDDNDGEAVERLVAGGGRPLDPATQANMETAFGEDFQDVRVHTGSDATASAQRLGAHAYTVGNDVVFSGDHDPGTTDGQRVLAHELAHVVQQRSGPVDGTDTGTGVKVSDPGDRFERAAEETAERVTSGQPAHSAEAAGAAGPAVQREIAGEEETEEAVQGMWVQREGMEEDEMPEEA
jgi:Domain of unknown function (DUF4157)